MEMKLWWLKFLVWTPYTSNPSREKYCIFMNITPEEHCIQINDRLDSKDTFYELEIAEFVQDGGLQTFNSEDFQE